MKKNSRIQLKDITETKKHLGERELSDVELKLVTGGQRTEGGTTSETQDTDA